ncbi:CCN family member 1-like isoform X2 [Myripristis murdjan]|uniref:CCN family member 1-like isoform X2 n=1 Tax=Myripristis murdjan TaxID=586833 RepID=UPI001176080F|nr:CCN family member 1-like isoform X2 [Myripristis murdjan]
MYHQLLKMWTVFVVAFLCGTLTLGSASCPKECRCPPEVPRCANLIMDNCGCCKICARQLNEDCSKTEPCDHIKGLECNFGGGTAKGICRAKSDGRSCEFNNRIYQNGESFHPNCKHQCTCMDGAVGCVSLCPRELTLPRFGCAKPRLVKMPGHCCEQLVCLEEGRSRFRKHSKQHRQSEDDLTSRNEPAPVRRGGPKSLPAFTFQSKDPLSSKGRTCVIQTTAWSPCSKSCGTGVSSRVTNNNSRCKLVKETRLCEVRPCNQPASLKDGQKCSHMEKARHPIHLSYAGCLSLKKFRPRYCGSCSDGRCCGPDQTQTLPVRFRCKDGDTFSKNVMMIQSCKCSLNCPRSNSKPPALYRHFSAFHTLRA